MRPFFSFLIFFQLSFSINIFAQQNDTAGLRYDSARAIVEKTVKNWQDSLEREKLMQKIQKNSKPLDVFLAEMKEKERKEERRKWIRLGAGATLLFMLFFTIARRYRQRDRA